MKVADVLRLLHDDGWRQVAMRGSHRQFKHTEKQGRVTSQASHRTTLRRAR